jgi:hypothetical protein
MDRHSFLAKAEQTCCKSAYPHRIKDFRISVKKAGLEFIRAGHTWPVCGCGLCREDDSALGPVVEPRRARLVFDVVFVGIGLLQHFINVIYGTAKLSAPQTRFIYQVVNTMCELLHGPVLCDAGKADVLLALLGKQSK